MEYPQLKVSGPAEDICNHYFVFANRHRYLANKKYGGVKDTLEDIALGDCETENKG